MLVDDLGPFDVVLDVGGNVGEFAEACKTAWPEARVTSFEPVPKIARENEKRAQGRWWVETVGISDHAGRETMRFCVNQHSASTMQKPGTLRRDRFGITDRFKEIDVHVLPLDSYLHLLDDGGGRALVKIDVEGHEAHVIRGGRDVLSLADVVVCEVNQDPDIFLGAPAPGTIDFLLGKHGLMFFGVAAVQLDPQGRVVQFDGVWSR